MATAAVCTLKGELFMVYMGEKDMERQAPDGARFQSLISEEKRKLLYEKTGCEWPALVITCAGGGSNGAGAFYHYGVTPETSPEHVRKLESLCNRFYYAVSTSSITGNSRQETAIEGSLIKLKNLELNNPVLVVFGICDREILQKFTGRLKVEYPEAPILNTWKTAPMLMPPQNPFFFQYSADWLLPFAHIL